MILDNAPVGIVQLDEERRYISANAAFQEFVGYSLEELQALTMFEITHPDDRAASVAVSTRAIEGKLRVRRFEKRYVRKDGGIVWGLVTSNQVKNPVTGRNELFTVVEDITELKKRERELKIAEAEIAHFFTASIDVMLVIGPDGLLRRVNGALLSLFGYEESDVLGRSLLEFIHPEDVGPSLAELGRLAKGEATIRFENRCRTKEGAYRLMSWNSVPDPESGLGFAIGRDITERRRDEARLAYSAKMASLGEMAGGMAHEVNNPLAIILGKVSILQQVLQSNQPDLDLVRTELTSIERTGQRIAKIIRGLRAFSRNSEADAFTRVNVAQMVEDTLSLCAERLRVNNVKLTVSCPPELNVRGRPSQLSQVLMNLISNAFDAIAEQSAPWIRIEAERRFSTVLLTVTDSGTSIETRVVEKMFQPFFTTKPVGKGTGLGLSISKGIMEDHGGDLRYVDNGGNTSFVLEMTDYDNV